MVKGFRYRIYPNKEQEQQLNQMLGNARFVYNWALDRTYKGIPIRKEKYIRFYFNDRTYSVKKRIPNMSG